MVAMEGITDAGKRRFGAFLQHCLDETYGSRSAASIAILEETGIRISESKLAELVHAQWLDKFKFDHIVALILSGCLKFPDGSLLDFNDVMEIFRGKLDPFTQERLGNGMAKERSV